MTTKTKNQMMMPTATVDDVITALDLAEEDIFEYVELSAEQKKRISLVFDAIIHGVFVADNTVYDIQQKNSMN